MENIIRVEFNWGDNLYDCLKESKQMAQRTNSIIEFNFNRTCFQISQNANLNEAYSKYMKDTPSSLSF